MPRRLPFAVIATLLLAAVLGGCADDSDRNWLVGSWELAYNPAEDDEDVLVFHKDGSMEIQTIDGRKVTGRYQIDGDRLDLQLALATRILEVSFTISPDRSRLIFEKTGAYYEHKP